MATLADKAILSGADNRPPILEKDMHDSWKSIMELYMMNRQHGRMILESVENGPLIWPTIEENGVTRPKKYSELSVAKATQANCDVKEQISFSKDYFQKSMHLGLLGCTLVWGDAVVEDGLEATSVIGTQEVKPAPFIENIVNIYKNLDSTFNASLVSSDVGQGTSHCPASCKTEVKDKKENVEMAQECNSSNDDSKEDGHSSDPSSRHRNTPKRPVDKDVYGTKLVSNGNWTISALCPREGSEG
nr:hypothetical protein [Tanacetum cinerariifolium]